MEPPVGGTASDSMIPVRLFRGLQIPEADSHVPASEVGRHALRFRHITVYFQSSHQDASDGRVKHRFNDVNDGQANGHTRGRYMPVLAAF